MKKNQLYLATLFITTLLSSFSFAQNKIQGSVIANGGTISSNETNLLRGTIGQSVIGRTNGQSNIVTVGFWEQARGIITGIASLNYNTLPTEFRLFQNYPNPFNPSTKIQFQITSNSQVSLKVYDILGNEIATLIDEEKPAGSYEINFDRKNLSSGVYFYKLDSGNFVDTKKMILLR